MQISAHKMLILLENYLNGLIEFKVKLCDSFLTFNQ